MSDNQITEQGTTENAEPQKSDVTIAEPSERLTFAFSELVHVVTNKRRSLSAITFLQVDPLRRAEGNTVNATATAKVLLPIDTTKRLIEALTNSITLIEEKDSQTPTEADE